MARQINGRALNVLRITLRIHVRIIIASDDKGIKTSGTTAIKTSADEISLCSSADEKASGIKLKALISWYEGRKKARMMRVQRV